MQEEVLTTSFLDPPAHEIFPRDSSKTTQPRLTDVPNSTAFRRRSSLRFPGKGPCGRFSPAFRRFQRLGGFPGYDIDIAAPV